MRNYGYELRRKRRELELTHGQVAEAIGIYPHTLIDIEKRKVNITCASYVKILAAMESLTGRKAA